MTSRRLVLFPAALLETAISLGFWLIASVQTGSSAAGTQAMPGTAAHSIPTLRERAFRGTVDHPGPLAPAGQTPGSPATPRSTARSWMSFARGGSRSSSSRSEQIPLLVGALEALRSALQHRLIRSWGTRFGCISLNQDLSLDGGGA
jgi:hypothetical protein